MNTQRDLPNFIIAGTVKSGTSWLHNALFQSFPEEIFLPIKKPIQFFDKNFSLGLDRYKKLFNKAKPLQIIGEASASYSVLPVEKIEYIKNLIPDLKILFLLRDPIWRDWSDARMELSLFLKKDLSKCSDQEFLEILQSDKIRTNANYPVILKNWVQCFGRDKIYIDYYEKIKSEPSNLIKNIRTFLNLKDNAPLEQAVLNKIVFKGVESKIPDVCFNWLNNFYDKSFYRCINTFTNEAAEKFWEIPK